LEGLVDATALLESVHGSMDGSRRQTRRAGGRGGREGRDIPSVGRWRNRRDKWLHLQNERAIG